jgi:hypothetical protein
MDRQKVINAFSKTPHPGDERLCSCHCEECQWEVTRFKGKKWTQLTLDDLATGGRGGEANVFLLTAEAFHYFLPGLVLLIDVNEGMEWLVRDVVSRLVVSDRHTESRRESVGNVIRKMNPEQRSVLLPVVEEWKRVTTNIPSRQAPLGLPRASHGASTVFARSVYISNSRAASSGSNSRCWT